MPGAVDRLFVVISKPAFTRAWRGPTRGNYIYVYPAAVYIYNIYILKGEAHGWYVAVDMGAWAGQR